MKRTFFIILSSFFFFNNSTQTIGYLEKLKHWIIPPIIINVNKIPADKKPAIVDVYQKYCRSKITESADNALPACFFSFFGLAASYRLNQIRQNLVTASTSEIKGLQGLYYFSGCYALYHLINITYRTTVSCTASNLTFLNKDLYNKLECPLLTYNSNTLWHVGFHDKDFTDSKELEKIFNEPKKPSHWPRIHTIAVPKEHLES